MSRAILYFSIAAIVSPPPAAENALLSATARETFLVPLLNCSISNTPNGPFQIIVLEFFTIFEIFSTVSGPRSNIISCE